MKLSTLIPAWFIGSPVALLVPCVLMHFMPVGAALAVGAVVGPLCGLALINALKTPARRIN